MIAEVIAQAIGEIVASTVRQAVQDAAFGKLPREQEPEPAPTMASRREKVRQRRLWRRFLDWA